MYSMSRETLGQDERTALLVAMHDAIASLEKGDPGARVMLGELHTRIVDGATLFLEAADSAYACLWRAYPPSFADSPEWQIDLWMLRERQKKRRRDFDMLALQALVATSPPYRSVSISHDSDSETSVRDFALILWGVMDAARACREIESAVKKYIPALPDMAIEHFHRSPDDEITWMAGSLGGEGFVFQQYSGSRGRSTLKLSGGVEMTEGRSYEAPTAEGWYGNQIFLNTLGKIVDEMNKAEDEILFPANMADSRYSQANEVVK